MMLHAREGTTERFRVEVNAFVDEYIGLAYHGMRAQHPDLIVNIERNFDDHVGMQKWRPRSSGERC
jgi:hypothetical protein